MALVLFSSVVLVYCIVSTFLYLVSWRRLARHISSVWCFGSKAQQSVYALGANNANFVMTTCTFVRIRRCSQTTRSHRLWLLYLIICIFRLFTFCISLLLSGFASWRFQLRAVLSSTRRQARSVLSYGRKFVTSSCTELFHVKHLWCFCV